MTSPLYHPQDEMIKEIESRGLEIIFVPMVKTPVSQPPGYILENLEIVYNQIEKAER